jgi:heme/copper-type cytochrome/quinol oxidase subunit 2
MPIFLLKEKTKEKNKKKKKEKKRQRNQRLDSICTLVEINIVFNLIFLL